VNVRSNQIVPETIIQSSPRSDGSNKLRQKPMELKEEEEQPHQPILYSENDLFEKSPDLSSSLSSVKALSSKVLRSISAKISAVLLPFDQKQELKNYQQMAVISSGGTLEDWELSSVSSTGSFSPSSPPPMANENELPNSSCFVREYRVNDRLHYFVEV
jgi:hypothetical protein